MSDGKTNFFTVNRRMLHHSLWLSEKFTRGQAWIDMIGLANHSPGWIRANGKRIDLQRGDLGWSKEHLAQRWRWTRKKVQRFFSELEADGMISVIKTQPTTVVSLCNYEHFQLNGSQSDPVNDSADDSLNDSADDPRRRRNENYKEGGRGLAAVPSVDVSEYMRQYAHFGMAKKFGEAMGTPPGRAKAIKGIVRYLDEMGVSLEKYFEQCLASEWLGSGDGQYKPRFNWFLKPDNALKILEGDFLENREFAHRNNHNNPLHEYASDRPSRWPTDEEIAAQDNEIAAIETIDWDTD